MVLGAVDPDLHGEVRRRERPRLPVARRLLWCGEVFPTPPLIYWMTKLPDVTFTNLYGPTEATIASSYHTLPALPRATRRRFRSARRAAGEDLLVLDRALSPVPPGEIGELYIRGVGLSPGYWHDPEKTAAAFLPDPRADPSDRIYKTGDLAHGRRATAWSTTSDAPTRRSRAAAIASSSGKSRLR